MERKIDPDELLVIGASALAYHQILKWSPGVATFGSVGAAVVASRSDSKIAKNVAKGVIAHMIITTGIGAGMTFRKGLKTGKGILLLKGSQIATHRAFWLYALLSPKTESSGRCLGGQERVKTALLGACSLWAATLNPVEYLVGLFLGYFGNFSLNHYGKVDRVVEGWQTKWNSDSRISGSLEFFGQTSVMWDPLAAGAQMGRSVK